MKLSPIPGNDALVKHALSLKTSTDTQLKHYQACYKDTHGTEVALRDMMEQMLLRFMAVDKDFQKWLKKDAVKPAAPIAIKPVASSE